MRILVVEDEYKEIEGLLDYVNFKHFNNTLEFENIRYSQDIDKIESLDNYDLLIVDIQLDLRSEKDGISFIKDILSTDNSKNVFLITGLRDGVTEKLKSNNLSHIQVLKKPLDDDELAEMIKSFQN
ncbi:MAG: response regulator [Arcobacteraceae bacterium]|nr:response regulator [Arcobacteraceae bacterium]